MTELTDKELIEIGRSIPPGPLVQWSQEQIRSSAGREPVLKRLGIDGRILNELIQSTQQLRRMMEDVQHLRVSLPSPADLETGLRRLTEELAPSDVGAPIAEFRFHPPTPELEQSLATASAELTRFLRDLDLKKGSVFTQTSRLAQALRQTVILDPAPTASPRLSSAA